MARAYGWSAHLLMKRETAYGRAAIDNYIRVPFNRWNLGSEQGLIDDPVLGQGRDPLAPLQNVVTDEGDIVVPVDPRNLGLWLTGLFGDPSTTDNLDGSWNHEFTSGSDDLPSYSHEVYLPKPKLAVEGPGGVQASFDFRGAKNDVAGRMLSVTLTKDLDGMAYA